MRYTQYEENWKHGAKKLSNAYSSGVVSNASACKACQPSEKSCSQSQETSTCVCKLYVPCVVCQQHCGAPQS